MMGACLGRAKAGASGEVAEVGALRGTELLGEKDPTTAAEEVGDKDGEREVDEVWAERCVEAFGGERDGGERGVHGGAKEGDEAKGSEEVDGGVEEDREGVAKRGTDKEERGDAAALEAGG